MTAPAAGPRKLRDYTLDEQNDREVMTYAQLCALRREAWREHIATMDADSQALLVQLRDVMTERYGPAAKAIHNAVPWDVAFMVARYGEEPAAHATNIGWPTSLTEDDKVRADQWIHPDHWPNGENFPGGFRPLGRTVVHDPRKAHLFGLDEFEGLNVTIVRPVAAEPAADSAAPSEG